MPWHITSFYQFTPQSSTEIAARKAQFEAGLGGMVGQILLAPEGINGTVAGTAEQVEAFKDLVGRDVRYKDSVSDAAPFRHARVDVRKEIVTMKRPDLAPDIEENGHLTAEEWHRMLTSGEPHVLVDTRNRYETKIGTFRGAIDPEIDHFSQWGAFADSAGLDPETPVMIFCTGGIRCEKVMLDLRARGLEKVYQLRDGILGYLAEYPDGEFEGECFVFDERVAVDGWLRPSERYRLCPGCGNPEDHRTPCPSCGEASAVCADCRPTWGDFCSKACRAAAKPSPGR